MILRKFSALGEEILVKYLQFLSGLGAAYLVNNKSDGK